MITYKRGGILNDDAKVLVNPVNTKGVMGAGLAKQVAALSPANLALYWYQCRNGLFKIGDILVYDSQGSEKFDYIINLPTKDDWRDPSRYEYIEQGLDKLAHWLDTNDYTRSTSIAIPALGCGLGGLDWGIVGPMIETTLAKFPNVDARVYQPK